MPKIQFRSKFEESVAKELRLLKQRIRYEKMSIRYAVQMFRLYKPDFVLNNGIIIEAKGGSDRKIEVKHLLIQEQYPSWIYACFRTHIMLLTKDLQLDTVIGVTSMDLNGQTRRYLKMVDREEEKNTTRDTEQVEVDTVNSPPHYNNGGMECIDYIRQQLGGEFSSYCQGNVIKYLHRWRYKNGVEDLKKAEWYLREMIREVHNRSMIG